MQKISAEKHNDHTKEEIESYLEEFKRIIKKGDFIIPTTDKRVENRDFVNMYKLKSKKQKEMLLNLEAFDFCYSVDNYNDIEERLYVFLKEYELDFWGIIKKVNVYIKVVNKNNKNIVIISMHEPKKHIEKLFK